jgi:cellobiose phosphorylase
MQETYIHSFKDRHEENAQGGIVYLRDHLDAKEAKVFFDEARRKKSANFEDQQGKNYTLSFDSYNTYTLVRRPY